MQVNLEDSWVRSEYEGHLSGHKQGHMVLSYFILSTMGGLSRQAARPVTKLEWQLTDPGADLWSRT